MVHKLKTGLQRFTSSMELSPNWEHTFSVVPWNLDLLENLNFRVLWNWAHLEDLNVRSSLELSAPWELKCYIVLLNLVLLQNLLFNSFMELDLSSELNSRSDYKKIMEQECSLFCSQHLAFFNFMWPCILNHEGE
jgi:hypothetical protein